MTTDNVRDVRSLGRAPAHVSLETRTLAPESGALPQLKTLAAKILERTSDRTFSAHRHQIACANGRESKVPAAHSVLHVQCSDCRHFLIDRVRPWSAIGHCAVIPGELEVLCDYPRYCCFWYESERN